MPVEFFGAEQRVDLAVMRVGVLQDGGDDMGLIGGVDPGVAGVGEGQSIEPFVVVADSEHVH